MKGIITAVIFLMSIPALAKTLHTSEYGFIVENKVTISASSERIWSALINDVDKWWPKDHSWWGAEGTFSMEPKAGGCFCEISGEKSAEHMHVVFVEPNKTLRLTGGLGPLQELGMTGTLNFVFEEREGKVEITMSNSVHGIYSGDYTQLAPIVDSVQAMQLQGLANFVSTSQTP